MAKQKYKKSNNFHDKHFLARNYFIFCQNVLNEVRGDSSVTQMHLNATACAETKAVQLEIKGLSSQAYFDILSNATFNIENAMLLLRQCSLEQLTRKPIRNQALATC